MHPVTHFLSVLLFAAGPWGIASPPASATGTAPVVEAKISRWSVPTPRIARDPAADADDNVYFAVAEADRIARFNSRSGQFREWALPPGTRPHGIAITRDGKVAFAGNGNGTLGELDPATGVVRTYSTSSAASRPYATTLDAQGNLWATLRAAGRVAKLDRASGAISEFQMDGEPYGLAFDRRGILWVTRIAADRLGSFDPKTGRSSEVVLGPGSKPRRIGVSPDGMLWVSLYGNGKVAKVDPVANTVVKEYVLPAGPNAGPYSVDVDQHGHIWILQFQADSIAILDPKSERFRVIRLPDWNSGARNATFDARGRYWYVATTPGKLGVVE